MSTTKVGGSFGTHASLSLDEGAELICEVHGIDEDDAARALLGDTQVGVARRAGDSAFITLKIPASFLGDALSAVELVIEAGAARVTHGRSGAEQSLDWRKVATLTIEPERAFVMSLMTAAVPLLASSLVVAEALSGPMQTSRARLTLDALTVVIAAIPMALAARTKAKGRSRYTMVRSIAAVSTLAVLGSTLSSVAIENQTGATITLPNGTRIEGGVSRWLPFEPAAQRAAITQRFDLITDREERACLRPPQSKPFTTRPWTGYRITQRGGASLSRSILPHISIREGDLCDSATSEGEVCCVRAERSEGTVPMQVSAPNVRAEWRLHMRTSSAPIDPDQIGPHSLRALSWHGLSFAGAQRALGRLEAHWLAQPAQRTLTLSGFGISALREFDLQISNGPTLHARCASTSDTVHAIRATHSSLRAFTVDATRVELRVNSPSIFCSRPTPQQISITVDRGAASDTEPPAWSALGPWPLPEARPSIEIFERRGAEDVHIGTSHCPVDRTPYVSIVPVRLDGFSTVERIDHHPAGGRASIAWQAYGHSSGNWAFLCVESEGNDVPPSERQHGNVASRLRDAPDFRVREFMQPASAHGRIAQDLRTITRDPSPLPDLARCCYDPVNGLTVTCPSIHRYQRFVEHSGEVPADCGSMWRVEWVRRPRQVDRGPNGQLIPRW